MLEINNQLSKYDVIARLLHLMDHISEDHQFLIFKKLFKDSLSSQIVKRIIDMTEHQQLILMKHLEEMVSESGNGDKRQTPRKDCLINVNMRVQGPRYNSYILDINQHGAYIETNRNIFDRSGNEANFRIPELAPTTEYNRRSHTQRSPGCGHKISDVKHPGIGHHTFFC